MNKIAGIYRLGSTLAAGAVTMVLMLGAGMAQAANVILDGNNNVIQIENLEVTNQLNEVTLYNVDFVSGTGSDVYGISYQFDFTQEEDGVLARDDVMDALNVNIPTPTGAGPLGTFQFFIGLEFDDTSGFPLIAALGAEHIISDWIACQTDCVDLVGTAVLEADQVFTYADFTEVTQPPIPVPAAAWLFGTGMVGLIGITRRRKA